MVFWRYSERNTTTSTTKTTSMNMTIANGFRHVWLMFRKPRKNEIILVKWSAEASTCPLNQNTVRESPLKLNSFRLFVKGLFVSVHN